MSKNAEISVPNWLNRDFVASNLKTHFNDQNLQIVHFDIRSAAANGQNYGSSVYRISVTLSSDTKSDQNLSLFVKIPVSDETILAKLLEFNVYKTEIEFYSQIVPKIHAIQSAQFVGASPFMATCYGVCENYDVLLLEDVASKSYFMLDRPFNFDETKFLLEKLASFHAINAILQQQNSEIFENFKYGTWNDH